MLGKNRLNAQKGELDSSAYEFLHTHREISIGQKGKPFLGNEIRKVSSSSNIDHQNQIWQNLENLISELNRKFTQEVDISIESVNPDKLGS